MTIVKILRFDAKITKKGMKGDVLVEAKCPYCNYEEQFWVIPTKEGNLIEYENCGRCGIDYILQE